MENSCHIRSGSEGKRREAEGRGQEQESGVKSKESGCQDKTVTPTMKRLFPAALCLLPLLTRHRDRPDDFQLAIGGDRPDVIFPGHIAPLIEVQTATRAFKIDRFTRPNQC